MADDDEVSGEFDDSHPIPQTQIKKEWYKEYPNKKMPKIEGYVVPEKDFKRTVSFNRKYGNREGEVKEYGRHLPLNKTTGTLIKDESTNTYLILRRSNAAGPVNRTVRHEMHHIAEKEGFGREVHSKVGGGNRVEAYQQGTLRLRTPKNNLFQMGSNQFNFKPHNMIDYNNNLFNKNKRQKIGWPF
jgi:hypothetical protein